MNRTVALQVEQRYKQCTETVDDDNPRMANLVQRSKKLAYIIRTVAAHPGNRRLILESNDCERNSNGDIFYELKVHRYWITE